MRRNEGLSKREKEHTLVVETIINLMRRYPSFSFEIEKILIFVCDLNEKIKIQQNRIDAAK